MVRTDFRHFARILVTLFAVCSQGGQSEASGTTPPNVPLPQLSSQSGTTPAAAGTPSLDQRTTVLEERLNTALALKDERITDLKDRIDGVYKLAAFVAAIASILLVLFSVRDIFSRVKEGQRQRGIDDIVKEMMRLQNVALTQQVALGAMQVEKATANPNQFGPVQNVSGVIEAVQKTLAFRLEQEQRVAEAIAEIAKLKAEGERSRKQKFDAAVSIFDHFRNMNRMQYAGLTDEQRARALRLVGLVGDLDDSLGEKGFDLAGGLLYSTGVIQYYENDVIDARTRLDRSAQFRAADHQAELETHESYRIRFAFIHYFRALIQKNWGDLSEALREIEQSAKLLQTRPGEFLTPVTKAEIRSYIVGDESRCRSEVTVLLKRIKDLETALVAEGKTLDANQVRLRNRSLLILGNTYVAVGDHGEARKIYDEAVKFIPDDYYALASVAQCCRVLNDPAASDFFARCLGAIERSGDWQRKRERITRALIVVHAARAARGCADQARFDQYSREARTILGGDLAVDGFAPKFFSPTTKRLVSAKELLAEVNQDLVYSQSVGGHK